MSPDLYYDKNGEQIDFETFCKLFEDAEYGHVGLTVLRAADDPQHEIAVSTRWSGINTESMEIFETALKLDGKTSISARYRTLQDAQEGHNEAVGTAMMHARGALLAFDMDPTERALVWGAEG